MKGCCRPGRGVVKRCCGCNPHGCWGTGFSGRLVQVKGGKGEGVVQVRGVVRRCRRYSPGTKGLHSYNVSYDSGGSTTDDDRGSEGIRQARSVTTNGRKLTTYSLRERVCSTNVQQMTTTGCVLDCRSIGRYRREAETHPLCTFTSLPRCLRLSDWLHRPRLPILAGRSGSSLK